MPLDFNYFALISLLLPFTISFVTENYRLYIEKARGELEHQSVKQLRDFIWATDANYPTWEDFINYFKEYGSELFQTREIPFDFQYTSDSKAPQPYSSIKFYLVSIYKEILGNILKHAQARNVSVN